MKILKYPIFPTTILFAIGIAVSSHWQTSITLLSILTAMLLLLIVVLYISFRKVVNAKTYMALCSGIVALLLGMLSYSLHHAPNQPRHYSNLLMNNSDFTIKGHVTRRLKPNDYNEKYYFEIDSINQQYTSGTLLLNVPKDSSYTYFHTGDVLLIYDTPKPIAKALNPSQFDYADYMKNQNIFHQVKLSNNYIRAGSIKNIDYYTHSYRNALINSFDKHNFSPDVIHIIKALLFGQRQDIDRNLREDYINAGVVHILAISGLHIAILFYILNIIIKPINRLGKNGRLLQLILTLTFLWGFAILAGLSASVVRAVVMFSFVAIGQFFNRNTNTVNSIAVSMLVLLIANPMFLFDIGFQLSYAAVFAIVILQPLYSKIKLSKYKIVNYFIDITIVSAIAQLGVLPLSLYYFNQFPLLFPLANIIVIPLVTIILIAGITVLLLNFINSSITLMLGEILSWLISTMNSFIHWVASFEQWVIKDISFTVLLTVLLYTLIILLIDWSFKKSYKKLITVLYAVLIFQAIYITTLYHFRTKEELIVLNNWNESIIIEKQSNRAIVYTNETKVLENYNINAFIKGNFIDDTTIYPLQNLLWYNQKKILIIDSTATYSKLKPDFILLTLSPKINLERLIKQCSPKAIIADATNYKNYIATWRTTCRKMNIPFHATTEKGYYSIK